MSLKEYLEQVGFAVPMLEKMGNLKKLADKICPQPIEDFFVSEYKKKDGERVFESVFFFSSKYVLESKRILLAESNLDLACAYKSIERCELTFFSYDPLDPSKHTDDSQLRIEGSYGNVFFALNATKENCSKLWSIWEKFIQPNVMEIIEIPS